MSGPQSGGWYVPSGLEWASPVVAYLLGSIPFGLVLVRIFRGMDLRTFGSGNIGATNAMRAAGKPVGYTVFLLDFLKGLAPVLWLAPALAASDERTLSLQVISGAMAVLGHCFPIYLRFRGGKGVSTGCGALMALAPLTVVAGTAVWLVVLFTTRYAGLASVLMGLSFPLAAWLMGAPLDGPLVGGTLLLALLIVVRHRSNIRRMLSGNEPKIGGAKPEVRA